MNLENKVKYVELSPSLQEMINNKLDTKEFNCHDNDEVRHIIQDERNYWNDVERICKEYTDDRVDELDKRLTKKIDNAEKRLEKKIDDLANSLSDIAFSGSYEDLGDQPIIYGMIIPFKGNKIPTGWHICDGTNGTPDLRDRFIVGAGRSYGIGATGGANTVSIESWQVPPHRHTFPGDDEIPRAYGNMFPRVMNVNNFDWHSSPGGGCGVYLTGYNENPYSNGGGGECS